MPGLTNQQPTLTSSIAGFQNAGGFGAATIVKSVTFNNTVGAVTLFTVTGDVMVRVIGVVKVNVASAAGCNGSVGIAGTPAGIIALTDITLMSADEIWFDNSPDAQIEIMTALREFILSNGNDIILTLSAQADSGQVDFYCIWTPLSAGATVV
jgi:hypothetical protein